MAKRSSKDYGIGALLSTLLMTIATGAAMWVHLLRPDYTDPEKILPMLSCVFGGVLLGWFVLSRRLDRGLFGSGLAGIATAGIGTVLFTVLAASRSAYLIQASGQFVSNPHMIKHTWHETWRVFGVIYTDIPTISTLFGIAFLAGLIGNLLRVRKR